MSTSPKRFNSSKPIQHFQGDICLKNKAPLWWGCEWGVGQWKSICLRFLTFGMQTDLPSASTMYVLQQRHLDAAVSQSWALMALLSPTHTKTELEKVMP
eukprot:3539657-Amphidinium_carterae.1